MIGNHPLSQTAKKTALLVVVPLAVALLAVSPTMAHKDQQAGNELEHMRREVKELRNTVGELRNLMDHMVEEQHKGLSLIDRMAEEQQERLGRSDRLSVKQLRAMAQEADLSERETAALIQLAEKVDFNQKKLESMGYADLTDTQTAALKKMHDTHDDHIHANGDDDRMSVKQLRTMAQEADLSELEAAALLQLAAEVDFNSKKLESMGYSGLTDTQTAALKKMHDTHDDHIHAN